MSRNYPLKRRKIAPDLSGSQLTKLFKKHSRSCPGHRPENNRNTPKTHRKPTGKSDDEKVNSL